MNKTAFEPEALKQYFEWQKENRKIVEKINTLIMDIHRNGAMKGLGKPEPLKHDLSGYWSRHITEEHRIVYKVENGTVFIKYCKGHYE